jgi:tRNA (guanine37-N1)-methyltransferase
MFFDILTLFPSLFEGVFTDSIIKRALEKGLVDIHLENIRDYCEDKHKSADDYPYGGDPGMLMKPEPLSKAIQSAKNRSAPLEPKVIYMSPQGETFTHAIAGELLKEKGLILICGRYKGIDQRIIDAYVDREISIGDYVLSGGEIPAMVMVETISRLIPGVLGNSESAEKDSFFHGLLSPPHYTRPEIFEGIPVPQVLISGHHEKIRQWQKEQAEKQTEKRRPDLWRTYLSRRA